MPLADNAHYVDNVGYAAVTAWAANTAISAGALRRQNAAPSVGNERVFVAIVGGTTHATTEPTWTVTRGAKNTDNTVTWQECTGLAGINGDITNTLSWASLKAITSSGVLGQLIKNNAGTHLFIMSTAGTIGAAQPTFDTTTGNTTADNTATWTCIGAVGGFTGNQAPHARMVNALATNWGAAGNDIYVKSSHTATQSTSASLTGASTIALPQRWLCHNGGAYPPAAANLTTGASETVTTNNVNIQAVGLYCEGITFSATGNGAVVNVGAAGAKQKFKNCVFARAGTTGTIIFGNAGTGNLPVIELVDCNLSFGNAGNGVSVSQCSLTWRGGAVVGAAAPTTLINLGTSPSHCTVVFDGVDLSPIGVGKTIVGALSTQSGLLRFLNCKTGAGVTLAATPAVPHYRVEFVNCNSGAVNYDSSVFDYAGTLTTETTIVYGGGASDGTTPISWKAVTTATASFPAPFECPPIALWNDTSGQKTLTIQGIWGDGVVPKNDEVWVEVEYLGNAAQPITSFVSDAKATVLTTGADQDAGSGVWGGSTTKFALAVTFTPLMRGPIIARVKCAKASSTFYIDPKPTLV